MVVEKRAKGKGEQGADFHSKLPEVRTLLSTWSSWLHWVPFKWRSFLHGHDGHL